MTTLDLLHLLQQLQDTPVFIRFRLTGRDWQVNYTNVLQLYGDMVYVRDCVNHHFSYIMIKDIIQLQLQGPFLDLGANVEYDVVH